MSFQSLMTDSMAQRHNMAQRHMAWHNVTTYLSSEINPKYSALQYNATIYVAAQHNALRNKTYMA